MKRQLFFGILTVIFILGITNLSRAEGIAKYYYRNDSIIEDQGLNLINHGLEKLELKEIYNLAKLNSIEFKKSNLELENAKMQFINVEDFKDIDPTEDTPQMGPGGQIITVKNPQSKLQMEINKEITYYQAKNGVDLAEKNIELAERNLQYQVTDLLITYAKANESVKLAQENLDRSQKYVVMTNSQYEQGLVPKSNVLDSEVALSQSQLGLKGAEMQLQIAKENILAAIGIDNTEGIVIDTITPDENNLTVSLDDIDNLLNFAYQHRIDYLMEEEQTNYESKRYDIYKDFYTYFGNQQDVIKSQKIVYEKEKLNLLNQKRILHSQLFQTILGYNNALEQLDSLQKNVDKVKESLNTAELRFDAGLGTLVEVLAAQVNVTQAENQLVDGKYQIMSMKNNLESAIGGTIDQYQEYLTTLTTDDTTK